MAKNISYKGKSADELKKELLALHVAKSGAGVKIGQGRAVKEYRIARKNIARVMTELNNSTNA